jgi:spermidine synthase
MQLESPPSFSSDSEDLTLNNSLFVKNHKFFRMGEMILRPLFAATIFTSAFLLFSVQPMIAKMILPLLGGTPAVWNTSMLFFQFLLLCGYLYSHVLTRWLSEKKQVLVHFSLVAIAVLLLPVRIPEDAVQFLSAGLNPIIWLLGLLFSVIGVPFFVLSASAPLLQKWFSRTSHFDSGDPYFLYSFSNMGSLVALLGYPVFIEPFLKLYKQGNYWAVIYGILFFLLGGCSIAVWKQVGKKAIALDVQEENSSSLPIVVGVKRRLLWMLLAFIPSSMMLGVTTYLTTDVASIPLFWIIPLSLYLLSYVIAFSRKKLVGLRMLGKIVAISAIVLVFCMLTEINEPIWLVFGLHLLFFFFSALLCHSLLAEERPHTEHLTEFYLFLSIGGVFGGIFNAIVAPMIFLRSVEYYIAIVLACLFSSFGQNKTLMSFRQLGDYIFPLAVGIATAAMVILIPRLGLEPYQLWMFVIFGLPLIVIYTFVNRALRFSLALSCVLVASFFYTGIHGQTIYMERNFFGTVRVAYEKEGPFHSLYDGTTIHGLQFVNKARQWEALSYYHREGPLGQIFQLYRKRPSSEYIGAIGLGVGSMLAYAQPDDRWTFYEINPAVIRIASNDKYFTFLKNAKPASLDIVLGDARLKIKDSPDRHFGLLLLDAFSSDVIPMHLVTREAFRIYLSKLTHKGIIAINISSRHVDLAPVISSIAADAGIYCFQRIDSDIDQRTISLTGRYPSDWLVLTADPDAYGYLVLEGWERLTGRPGFKLWTDDFSNLLKVLRWK